MRAWRQKSGGHMSGVSIEWQADRRVHAFWDRKWCTGCLHGPKVWPWWKLFSFSVCGHNKIKPTWDYFRLWVYRRRPCGATANHGRVFLDFTIDRRKL